MTAGPQIIARLGAVHPNRADLGVCIAPLRPTGGCMDRESWSEQLRADFHLVILCSGGSGEQVVDLVAHHHEPGSLVWIRPGQVHFRPPAIQGTAVCFTDAFLGDEASMSVGPLSWLLAGDDRTDVGAHLAVLEDEYQRYVFGPTGRHLARGEDMLRHMLMAFLLRVQQAPPLQGGALIEPHPAALAFLAMVEQSFPTIHTVGEYAAALGYSSKTIARASVEATGLNPKQIIDARLVLEARRLLAHTEISVCSVGRHLGFDDPANFCKFFTRATGSSPGTFRAAHRA